MLAYQRITAFIETALMPHWIVYVNPYLTIAVWNQCDLGFNRPFWVNEWLPLCGRFSVCQLGKEGFFVRDKFFIKKR